MQDTTKEKLAFLLIPVCAIIIIAIIIYIYYVQPPKPIQSLGQTLPQLSAPELLSPDKQFSNALLDHRIELISFWSSDCKDCEEQQNLLMFLASAHLVAIYGIDFQDSSKKAKKFLMKHGDPFKAIAVDKNGRIGILLGINTIPETFLVDQHNKVRDEIIGPITPIIWFDRLKPEIENLRKKSTSRHYPSF